MDTNESNICVSDPGSQINVPPQESEIIFTGIGGLNMLLEIIAASWGAGESVICIANKFKFIFQPAEEQKPINFSWEILEVINATDRV